MANEEHRNKILEAVQNKDIGIWNKWREENPDVIPDLQGIKIESGENKPSVQLVSANFNKVDLRNAKFINVILNRADFSHANLESTTFQSIQLENAILNYTNLRNATLRVKAGSGTAFAQADLSHANLSSANLQRVSFDKAIMENTNLYGATLQNSTFRFANLYKCNLIRCNLSKADLEGANLKEAKLQSAQFQNSNLINACLLDIEVDTTTSFKDSSVGRCQINRYVLESLENYGNLTTGQRMQMAIEDPVARLRSYYSGFWQWIHLSALVLFIFPYAYFLFKNYLNAQFNMSGETIALWYALILYIFKGGQLNETINWWPLGWLPFASFIFQFSYNTLRAVLLAKTKSLELYQDSTGLSATFSLTGTWGQLLKVANTMFVINIVVVLYHTIHFLQMRVPLIGIY